MINKLFLVLLAFPLSLSVLSQGVDYSYELKHIPAIKQATLYVIPTKDANYNDSIDFYMKKFWKATTYKTVSREEADLLLKEETNYFLASVNVLGNNGGQNSTVLSPGEDFSSSVYLFHGTKKSKLKNIQYQDALFCRQPFFGQENYLLSVSYVIKNLNDNVEMLIKLNEANKLFEKNAPSKSWIPFLRDDLSKRAKVLKGKTLLIAEETIKKNFKEKVLSTYKYPYKVVSTPELVELVKSDPKKYCFIAANEDFDIYDAESKQIIFSIETRTGSGLTWITEKHLQKLHSAIEK